jgi:hypothetical protein
LIASLHEQGAIRSGLSLDDAADVLWALTSFDLCFKKGDPDEFWRE